MDFHPQDVIISLINIVVLFVLLRLILWKHVIRFLAERKERVQNEIDTAEKNRQDAEALQLEYKKQLGEIEERGRDLIRESQAKANEESARILEETRARTEDMIADAEARIKYEKEQALENSREEVTQLATEMAARILQREVSAEDNVNVVNEFFSIGSRD